MVPVVWISALVLVPAATLLHVLQPKVPLYQFRVRNFPLFRWHQQQRNDAADEEDAHSLRTTLHAQVLMQNDNYVSTAIHALAFDLYFPTWDGTLHNIGHVVDRQQEQQQQQSNPVTEQQAVVVETYTYSTTTTTPATSLRDESSSSSEALWVMQARQAFETTDRVHLTVWLRKLGRTLTHLLWQTLKRGGVLHLPSTGVVHVKAAGRTKLTLSMICDNRLNVLTMHMEGKECTMHKLATGWTDIRQESKRIRDHVATMRMPKNGRLLSEQDENDDGSLLNNSNNNNNSEGDPVAAFVSARHLREQPLALLLA